MTTDIVISPDKKSQHLARRGQRAVLGVMPRVLQPFSREAFGDYI
ncbi:hypothetical protein [Candidimonas sp. SYP-B2681]|nr:hypothetical protein [Candidimonas sp. SYP-B2681]